MGYDSKRARALQISFYLLGRHRDAMRQWLKKSLSELLYARASLKCLCLSIPEHFQHYPVIWHPLIHRAVLLSRHHNLKPVTLELSCALGSPDPNPTADTHPRVYTLVCCRDADI